MRGKRDVLRLSVLLMILSFIVYTICHYGCLYISNINQAYINTISSGIFTGTIVSVLFTWVEYIDCKREVLEDYYNVTLQHINQFHHLCYLHIDEPLDLVFDYYNEITKNKQIQIDNDFLEEQIKENSSNKQLCKSYKKQMKKFNTKSKDALMKWMYMQENVYNKKEFKKNYTYWENYLNAKIEYYDTQINTIMHQYINIVDNGYRDVENAYGKIAFYHTNQETLIYIPIHKKMRDMLKYLDFEMPLFREYLKGVNCSKVSLITQIYSIQQKLYTVESKEICDIVYEQYCYGMVCELDNILKYLYQKDYKDSSPNKESFKIASINWRL